MTALLEFAWSLFVCWVFCAAMSYLLHEVAGLPAPWEKR